MKLETRFEAIQRAIVESDTAGDEERQALHRLMKEHDKLNQEGFKHYMADYIETWTREFRDEDGERTRCACSCTHMFCDLKSGDVPAGIRNKLRRRYMGDRAAQPEQAVRDYLFETCHGDPVLKELLDDWHSRESELKQQAMELHMRIQAMDESEADESEAEAEA